MTEPGLNENHLRRLATSLHLLEAAAERVDLLLRQGAVATPQLVVTDALSPEMKELVLLRLQQLREEIARTMAAWRLPPRARDLGRILNAEISSMWVNLEDLRPHRMLGRGPIAPQAAEALEAHIGSMLALVDDLRLRLGEEMEDEK